MKLKLKLALFHCGRCGKDFSSLLGHACVVRRPAARGTTVAVRASVTPLCGACGKPAGNPLTHVCVIRTDFKRRKKAAAKKAAAAKRAAAPKHLYQSCQDKDCKRMPCAAFREGREEGRIEGEETGYAKGYAAGVRSCS